MKISAVISAYNAEETIDSCLKSIKWVDEIIFVDNNSTDKTAEIAKKYTKKIYQRENNPMLNVNKNFGFTKATGDWILYLDSDEECSSELKEEVQNILKDPKVDSFFIPRKNIIFGKWIEHSGWYPDYQLRLFKKGKGKFEEKHVHEMIQVEGSTEKLIQNILHENYKTVSQFIQKHAFLYAPNEAEQLVSNGYEFSWIDAIRFPHREFIKRFFAEKGYKDGLHGLVLSLLMAFYHLMIFTLIWEKQKFSEVSEHEIVQKLEKEKDKLGKELNYWFLSMSISRSKNPLKKLSLRLRRKANS